MTISAIYTVHCQGCGAWAGQEDSAREALTEAKRLGFKRIRVRNGSMWDFCAKCYTEYKKAQEGEK